MSNKIENAFYVRSNTSESLLLQLNNGENYGKQNSLIVRVIEDSNFSGLAPLHDRPGMRQLLDMMITGGIKTIVTCSLHRISRDSVELLYFLSLLEEHNVKLIFFDGGEAIGK